MIARDGIRGKQGYRCLQNEPSIITRKEPAPYRVGHVVQELGTESWQATAASGSVWGLNRGWNRG